MNSREGDAAAQLLLITPEPKEATELSQLRLLISYSGVHQSSGRAYLYLAYPAATEGIMHWNIMTADEWVDTETMHSLGLASTSITLWNDPPGFEAEVLSDEGQEYISEVLADAFPQYYYGNENATVIAALRKLYGDGAELDPEWDDRDKYWHYDIPLLQVIKLVALFGKYTLVGDATMQQLVNDSVEEIGDMMERMHSLIEELEGPVYRASSKIAKERRMAALQAEIDKLQGNLDDLVQIQMHPDFEKAANL